MRKPISTMLTRALSLAPLALLLAVISCNNLFNPPDYREGPAPADGRGRVRISLDSEPGGQRTLKPEGVSFVKYRLSFSGPETADPIFIDQAAGHEQTLAAGDWTIAVEAYTSEEAASSNKPAARGSAKVKLANGGTAHAGIILRPIADDASEKGTFVYRINDPDGLLNYGNISLRSYGNGSAQGDNLLSESYPSSWNNGFGVDKRENLAPGQYLLQVQLQPKSDAGVSGMVYKTEIVHIYANLETRADYAIDRTQFVEATTISGSIAYKENGEIRYGYPLYAYQNPARTGPSLGNTYINDKDSTFSLNIPRPEQPMTVYLFIYADGQDKLVGSVEIPAGAKTVTKDLSYDAQVITLEGSVAITGASPDSVDIYIYPDPARSYNNRIGNTRTSSSNNYDWSAKIDVQEGPVPLYITVEYYVDGFGWVSRYTEVQINGTANQTGIKLEVDASKITLFGTVDLRVGGQAPESARIAAYTDDDRKTEIGSGGVIDTTTGRWSITLDNPTIERVYLTVFGTLNGEESSQNDYRGFGWLDRSDRYWDMGTIDITPTIRLSGIITITLDGSPLSFDDKTDYLRVSHSGNNKGASVTGSSWAAGVPSYISWVDFSLDFNDRQGISSSSMSSYPLGTHQVTGSATINLNFPLRSLRGTLKSGSAAREGGIIVSTGNVTSIDDDLENQLGYSLGWGYSEKDGSFAMAYTISTEPAYLYAYTDDGSFYKYTTQLSASTGNLSLDITNSSQMTFIGQLWENDTSRNARLLGARSR